MRLAHLNLQADAARRSKYDSDVTLVNSGAPSVAASVYDSETEIEESVTGRGDRATRSGVTAAVGGRPSTTDAGRAERQMAPGKKEKNNGKRRKKSFMATLNKVGLMSFSGSAPKSKPPPGFVIYPI
jgi:hypothetical protein